MGNQEGSFRDTTESGKRTNKDMTVNEFDVYGDEGESADSEYRDFCCSLTSTHCSPPWPM